MTRRVTTNFGEPLSAESKQLIKEVRAVLAEPMHSKFDNDFNIYRFILNAERAHKNRDDIIESAVKALTEHVKVRKCFKLDELPVIDFKENRIFCEKFLPCGEIQKTADKSNRLLWFIEYATISVEGIAHVMKSSEAIRWQFRQFEHMLKYVNEQEKQTGQLSSLRHIIDMNGYEINPFTMLFVSSGTLSYYSQLFHYENYPELVNPIELVNIAKWIHMPYKLIKAMMPAGFSDRFRLHDGNFLQHLETEIHADHIPTTLGGKNKTIKCIPAEKPLENWKATDHKLIKSLESINISPRKFRYFRIITEKPNQIISWYFRTDGDIYFGVFYESLTQSNTTHFGHEKDLDYKHKKMVYPWLKLSAKLVDENDGIICGTPGVYYIVFSNKHSWLQFRSVDAIVLLSDQQSVEGENNSTTPITKRFHFDGTQTEESLLSENHFPTLFNVTKNALSWHAH